MGANNQLSINVQQGDYISQAQCESKDEIFVVPCYKKSVTVAVHELEHIPFLVCFLDPE